MVGGRQEKIRYVILIFSEAVLGWIDVFDREVLTEGESNITLLFLVLDYTVACKDYLSYVFHEQICM